MSKAPPPPAPPRRFPSGVAPRGTHEAYEAYKENEQHESPEPTTRNGFEDPPTMSAHGAPLPKSAPPASSLQFDDETQMRQPDGRLIAASRHPEPVAPYDHRRDDETQAREHAVQSQAPSTIPHFPEPAVEHRHDAYAQDPDYGPDAQTNGLQPLPGTQQPDLFDSLPSLEMRRPYDAYEAEFAERDPATQLHGAHERRDEGEHYPEPREGSGARERPRKQVAQIPVYDDSVENEVGSYRREQPQPREQSYDREPPRTQKHVDQQPPHSHVPPTRSPEPAPRYEEPVIPPAPRVPAGFIVGVQPIRTPPTGNHSFSAHDSYPQQQQQQHHHHHQAPAQNHYSPPPPPPTMHASPRGMMQAPMNHGHQGMHQQQPMHRGHHAMPYAQQVFARPQQMIPTHPARGPVEEQPSSTSKTLRFAWFVFGVAFGIGFTFFASGVVPGLKREEPAATAAPAPSATFPPPAPILSNAPPPVQAPVAVQPPPVQAPPFQAAPPPVLAAAPPVHSPPMHAENPPTTSPSQLPNAGPKAAWAPPLTPPPPRVASAPRTYRRSPPSNGGSSPKALPNSGSVEASDDGPSASLGGGGGGGGGSAPAKAAPKELGNADLFGAALNP